MRIVFFHAKTRLVVHKQILISAFVSSVVIYKHARLVAFMLVKVVLWDRFSKYLI